MKFKQYLLIESKNKLKKPSLKAAIMNMFTKDNKVTVSDITKLSDKLDYSEKDVEETIYSLLTSFLNKGKYNESGKQIKFDEKELEMGIKVEMEHTNDKDLAERIAKDHLTEIPGTGNNDGYYSLLERMEAGVYDKE